MRFHDTVTFGSKFNPIYPQGGAYLPPSHVFVYERIEKTWNFPNMSLEKVIRFLLRKITLFALCKYTYERVGKTWVFPFPSMSLEKGSTLFTP